MSRIVIFEVPNDSRLTLLELTNHLKKLENKIEPVASIQSEYWREMSIEFDASSLPIFPTNKKRKKPTVNQLKKLASSIKKIRTTPMKQRKAK